MTCQRFAHDAGISSAESSVEPRQDSLLTGAAVRAAFRPHVRRRNLCRLLSYIGRLVAFGVAASGAAGKEISLSNEELQEATRAILMALEVGDVLLGMGDARAATRQTFSLSAMNLDEGGHPHTRFATTLAQCCIVNA